MNDFSILHVYNYADSTAWWDEIVVNLGTEVFADGFESGSTSVWSGTSP